MQPIVDDRAPTAEEPAFADIGQLGRWIRENKTTPTRLAEYYLDRLERLGPKYNAVITVTRDRALAEAKRAEAELATGNDRGPLHGVPYGAKDLLAAVGAPTTWGATPFREQTFDFDATVIARLAEAGAVLVGKLAMVEIAGGMGYRQANASFTGPGVNPWNVEAWSGGSSTGPGSAVAAGLVPFAIGSETWGSIVTPATYCGVTGLRPTYGRVSRHGAMALSWTLDKIGPMTRTARDAAMVLAAIAGSDPRDPTTLDAPFRDLAPAPDRPWRFGVIKNVDGKCQPEVAANFQTSLALLRTIGDVVEVEIPKLPFDWAASIILSAEMASAMEDLIGSERAQSLAAPEDRHGGVADTVILAVDYLRALRIRGKAMSAMDEWLKGVDAVVSPALPAVASPLAMTFRDYYANVRGAGLSGAANLVGVPCMCVPNGFGERGLPTGIELLGGALSEERLLRIAVELQSRTDWHTKHPKT
jgi:aspartyl-tRNA(Asn)/glutamyl-tRNA(Gln) amidotransferase subunit A